MAWYMDRVGDAVAPSLGRGEALISAIPAFLPAHQLRSGHGLRRSVGPRPIGAGVATLLQPQVASTTLPFAGRMVLAVTERRMLVFERRRWRVLPGRLLGSIPISSLGNIEGHYRPTGGLGELELTVILLDGTAVTLRVPQGFVDDGKAFVRRVQVVLHRP